MKRLPGNFIRTLLATVLLGIPASLAQPFQFAAIGDMPYFVPADYQRFERVIAEINRRAPAFTIHVGDIMSGHTVLGRDVPQDRRLFCHLRGAARLNAGRQRMDGRHRGEFR